jgi:hypothetical protein
VIGKVKISFLLLCHEPPPQLRQLISSLLESGSNIFVHYDANSTWSLEYESQSWGLGEFPGKLYFARRERVAWGEWSIVQATLNCLQRWRELEDDSDYLMLISGSCLPIKPLGSLTEFLSKAQQDFIETVHAENKRWVSHGDQEERWAHYCLVSWLKRPRLFALSSAVQKLFRINREVPLNHAPHLGSQWWCLRTRTVGSLLTLIDKHPELTRFYRKTWIPDELFFQTLVANTIPAEEISGKPLTLCSFNSRGVAEKRYDDSLGSLMLSDMFFTRKISSHASELKRLLRPVFSMPEEEFIGYRKRLIEQHLAADRRVIALLRGTKNTFWHAFASSAYEESDYCRSIPNRVIVICGGTWDSRRQLSFQLGRFKGVIAFGHLFNPGSIDFGKENQAILGLQPRHHLLASHRWHYFLGDICRAKPRNIIVFCLGENLNDYILTLKQKNGLAILVLDDDNRAEPESSVDVIYEKSRLATWLEFENTLTRRACQVHRLEVAYSEETLETLVKNLQH